MQAVFCDEIIANLNYCIENKGLRIYAFVIMPTGDPIVKIGHEP